MERESFEFLHPSEITPYPTNANRHPERQIVQLVHAIGRYGFLCPILIDEHGVILAGHARFEAATRLGLTVVPILRIRHLSEVQKKAFRIADNKLSERSQFDPALLKSELLEILDLDAGFQVEDVGLEIAEFDQLVLDDGADASTDPAADPDDAAPEPDDRQQPVARLGDHWRVGSHRIICADCRQSPELDRLMGGDLARLVLTDPPYNVRIRGNVSRREDRREFAMASGELSEDAFLEFLCAWINPVLGHLVDGGLMYAFMDWRGDFALQTAARSANLDLLNLCVWNKTNGGMGSFYRSKHELCFLFKTGRKPHINNVQLGQYGRYRTNVWDYAGANSFSRTRDADLDDHPTVKPVAMLIDAIRDSTRPNDLVLDPFLGSGSTLIAAHRTGRIGRGVEIDPAYVDVALRRLSNIAEVQPVLNATGETFEAVAARRVDMPPPRYRVRPTKEVPHG